MYLGGLLSMGTRNRWTWKPGRSGNPRGRPPRARRTWIWGSKAAQVAFQAVCTPEARQEVSAAILELARRPAAPFWALHAVADAVGLDKEYIRRTGHLPQGKVYVWG